MNEFSAKVQKVKEFMASQGLDAIYLARQDNFSWLTGGRSSLVNMSSELGTAAVVLTQEKSYLLTDRIEEPRMRYEELVGLEFEYQISEWFSKDSLLPQLTKKVIWGADTPIKGAKDIAGELARLRFSLTDQEIERYKWLGRATGDILQKLAMEIKPGLKEQEIAGNLADKFYSQGIAPIVTLIGTDDRIFKYRHPVPTEKKLQRYAMIVVCARKWGLVASATRLIHFGKMSKELKKKMCAVAEIDANFIANTKPGTPVSDIFRSAVQKYSEVGYPHEWKKHHQGGATGYQAREYLAGPDSMETVMNRQAFAWNPSIAGVKSEDTIIVSERETEIITQVGNWPRIEIEVEPGIVYPRPAALEIL